MCGTTSSLTERTSTGLLRVMLELPAQNLALHLLLANAGVDHAENAVVQFGCAVDTLLLRE